MTFSKSLYGHIVCESEVQANLDDRLTDKIETYMPNNSSSVISAI